MSQQENQLIKILFLRRLLRKSQKYDGSQAFGKFGIGVTKYELCSNLKDTRNFSLISTIQMNSKDKITYQTRNKKFQNKISNICTDGLTQYIEQIYNNALLISGGQVVDQTRFTIHNSNNKTLEFQMNEGRRFHRTSFDKQSLIFIISGQQIKNNQYKNMSECEVYNLRTKEFKQINSIEMPLVYFGCDQTASQLYVFGGYQISPSQTFNTIQIYDKTQNIWQKGQIQLDKIATASAIYIPDKGQIFIYNNGYFNLDTSLFDFKKIINQNELLEVDNINSNHPVLSRNIVFQFDRKSDLFSYDLSSKGWRKIKA